MAPEDVIELAKRIADVAATDGDETRILNVTIGELADGSRRPYAIAETFDPVSQLEQTYRVCAPAPDVAPLWAIRDWSIEVRIADTRGEHGWLRLEEV